MLVICFLLVTIRDQELRAFAVRFRLQALSTESVGSRSALRPGATGAERAVHAFRTEEGGEGEEKERWGQRGHPELPPVSAHVLRGLKNPEGK